MIRAFYRGCEVLAVDEYVDAAPRFAWITVRRFGSVMSLCVSLTAIELEVWNG